MIEILDKINDTNKIVPFLDFAIHPLNGQITDLREMKNEYIELGKMLTGVIFKKDGTTMLLYEKKEE